MDPIRAAEVFPELLRFSDRFLAVQEDRDSDREHAALVPSVQNSCRLSQSPHGVRQCNAERCSFAAKSLNESKILILTSDFAGTLEGDRGDTIARWLIRRFIASGDMDAVIDSVCLRGRESRYLVEQAKSAAAGRV